MPNLKWSNSVPAVLLPDQYHTIHITPISVQLVFISQMLQITETNKVFYDVSLDTFKDHLESAAVGKLEGHG